MLPADERHQRNAPAFPSRTLDAGERVRVILADGMTATGTLTQPYVPTQALRLDIDDGDPDVYLYDRVQRVEHVPADARKVNR